MPNYKLSESLLSDWLATEQGQYILQREQAYFDRTVPDLFGYFALQLGLPEFDFLRNNRMPHRLLAGQLVGADVMLECTQLPFASDSLDLIVMPHVLEFSEYPHQVLREVARVLRPEGQLILSGFNPRSLWGLRRLGIGGASFPWSGNFLSVPRIKDWLTLLSFDIVGGRYAGYAPPFQEEKWLNKFSFMEPAGDRWWAVCGGIYFIHAVKRVHSMTVISPRWSHSLVEQLLPVSTRLNDQLKQRINHKNHE